MVCGVFTGIGEVIYNGETVGGETVGLSGSTVFTQSRIWALDGGAASSCVAGISVTTGEEGTTGVGGTMGGGISISAPEGGRAITTPAAGFSHDRAGALAAVARQSFSVPASSMATVFCVFLAAGIKLSFV